MPPTSPRGRHPQPRHLEPGLTPPPGMDAVCAALLGAGDLTASVVEAARRSARDDQPLGIFLADLEQAHQVARRPGPSGTITRTAAVAWADTHTLTHVTECEIPLLGLSTKAHLRARLRDLYRSFDFAAPDGGEVAEHHRVLLVELDCRRFGPSSDGGTEPGLPLDRALGTDLRLAVLADAVRMLVGGVDTLARYAPALVVGLVAAHADITALEEHLDQRSATRNRESGVRAVRLEPLPGELTAALGLLDEAARRSPPGTA